MSENPSFSCQWHNGSAITDATCRILQDRLDIHTSQEQFCVDFSVIQNFKLLNYQLIIETPTFTIGLSGLGHQTESFFEKLWQAYNRRCEEALFIDSSAMYVGEGDFLFSEQNFTQQGLAKIALYPQCLAIYPQNSHARRFPFCFSADPVLDGYRIKLTLDTEDSLQISRLGRNTLDIFDKICRQRSHIIQQWQEKHLELEEQLISRLGEKASNYQQMQLLGCQMTCGLYTADNECFWFAGLHNGKAAVELVTSEQTATYLYQYDSTDTFFANTLRHAMESAALHREVIFTDLSDKPLYQMTVQRSRFIQFLRDHNTGRIIHNSGWSTALSSFFQ